MISISLRDFDRSIQGPPHSPAAADATLSVRDVGALLRLLMVVQRAASDERGWDEVGRLFVELCESLRGESVGALRAVRECMECDGGADNGTMSPTGALARLPIRVQSGDVSEALRAILAPAIAQALDDKASQGKLAVAEARLDLCFEHCAQGMLTFAADGTCLFVNRAAVRLLKLVIEPRPHLVRRQILHRSVRKLIDEFIADQYRRRDWQSVRSIEVGGERVQCFPLVASTNGGGPPGMLLHLFLIAEARSDDLAARLLRRARLSRQETAVVRAVIDGKSNSGIAREMNLSVHTVRTYIERIYEKLDVNNRHELMKLVTTVIDYPTPADAT